MGIDKVTDFAKHHCSEELKTFLQVEENMRQVCLVQLVQLYYILDDIPNKCIARRTDGTSASGEWRGSC